MSKPDNTSTTASEARRSGIPGVMLAAGLSILTVSLGVMMARAESSTPPSAPTAGGAALAVVPSTAPSTTLSSTTLPPTTLPPTTLPPASAATSAAIAARSATTTTQAGAIRASGSTSGTGAGMQAPTPERPQTPPTSSRLGSSTTVGPLSPTTATPSPASVTIDSPAPNETVPETLSVRGTATGVPAGRALWLVVRPLQDEVHYPQGPGGPLTVVDGAWETTVNLAIDQPSPDGRYVLFVVDVDEAGSAALARRLADGPGRALDELPPGAQKLAAVLVARAG